MRLRKAVGKRKTGKLGSDEKDEQAGEAGSDSEDQLIEDLWQEITDLEGIGNGTAPANDSEHELACEEEESEQQNVDAVDKPPTKKETVDEAKGATRKTNAASTKNATKQQKP